MIDPAIELIGRFRDAERAAFDANTDEDRVAAADEAWRVFLDLACALNASGILSLHLRQSCELGFEQDVDPMQGDPASNAERHRTFELCATVLYGLALSLQDDNVSRRLNDAATGFLNRIQGSNTAIFNPIVEGQGNRSDPIDVRAAKRRIVEIVFFKSSLDKSNTENTLDSLKIGVPSGTFKRWKERVSREKRKAAQDAGRKFRLGGQMSSELHEIVRMCEGYLSNRASLLRLAAWATGASPFAVRR